MTVRRFGVSVRGSRKTLIIMTSGAFDSSQPYSSCGGYYFDSSSLQALKLSHVHLTSLSSLQVHLSSFHVHLSSFHVQSSILCLRCVCVVDVDIRGVKV